MKTLRELGEISLIERIQKKCGTWTANNFSVQVANGDDAFVLQTRAKTQLLFSTDTLVENTHFNLEWMARYWTPKQLARLLGEKLMAVNLSDLAAMGDVRPIFALITLGLNGDTSASFVDNFYDGAQIFLRKCGYCIAGGDIIRSEKSILSATIVGEAISSRILRRSCAQDGDILMVSGAQGCAAAGLKILQDALPAAERWEKKLLMAQVSPQPRLEVGSFLAQKKGGSATAAIDTSDDLFTSLEILSKQSGLGIEVQLQGISLDKNLLKFCQKYELDPWEFFMFGGEDYQLLFTVPYKKVETVQRRFPESYVIGTLRKDISGIRILQGASPAKLKDKRFNHFK